MEKKTTIEVGCAIIRRRGKVLIAQRPYGVHLGGYWEFPGGKREAAETIEACLKREVLEELGVSIEVARELCVRYHEDSLRCLMLRFHLCDWIKGVPVKKECLDFRLVSPEDLPRYLFPPADRDIIQDLIRKKRFYFQTGPFI